MEGGTEEWRGVGWGLGIWRQGGETIPEMSCYSRQSGWLFI